MREWLATVDWQQYFVPQMTLPEILIWGTLLYVALTILMRVVPTRQAGNASINDILFVVLVGGITVEGLGKHGGGVTDFVLLLVTVMAESYLIDWLTYRFKPFRRLLEPKPTPLIRDGKILKKNLEKEMIAEEELQAQLRLHEVSDPSQVKDARLESEGDISVVRHENGEEDVEKHQKLHEETASQKNGVTPTHRNVRHRYASTERVQIEKEMPNHSEVEEAVHAFLDAARRIEEAVGWHEAQAEGHQHEAAELRRFLNEHGVKQLGKKPRKSAVKPRKQSTPSNDAERN